MSIFSRRDTYDMAEAKVLKQAIDAAYHLGTSGTENNQKAIDALNKCKADVAAIIRVQQMFTNVSPTDKMHKLLNRQLAQENKWVAHHTKLIEATKHGYEKLKTAAKVAGLIDEAFAAGEAEAEKKLKMKSSLQAKVEDKNNSKPIDPKFQQQDGQHKNQQNNQNAKGPPINLTIKRLVVADEKSRKKNKNKKNQFMQRIN